MKAILFFTSLVLLLGTLIFIMVQGYLFQINCLDYLKRAANAGTIEVASIELSRALEYMEKNQMTEGFTSIIYETADEDVGFWYNNLKTQQAELINIDSTADLLTASNQLLKLRETIMEGNGGIEEVTHPDGISRFPNNHIWASILLCLTISTLALGAVWAKN